MVLSFWTDRPGQTVQTQIRLILKEKSDQGHTVCYSMCIFLMHYSMIKLSCLTFWVITPKFSGVQIFRIFTVYKKTQQIDKKYNQSENANFLVRGVKFNE